MSRRRWAVRALAVVLAAAVPASVAVVDHAHRPLDDGRYTLLVMGSDMGPWRPETVLDGRADAMHLVSVVPGQQAASILSFPRDLYVPVAGYRTSRINDALTRGPDTAVATVESLVGVEVDDWIVTGMSAFGRGISEYGGVEVDVPQRLRIDDNVLEPGRRRLDGIDTLLYTRDRKSRSDGDFGRNRAQAEVLALLHADLVARQPTPSELLRIIGTLRRYTVSSIPAARYPVLAGVALDIDPDRVVRVQVPGRNAMRGAAAVVVETSGAAAVYADLREDGLLSP